MTREVTEEKQRRAFNTFLDDLRRKRAAQVRVFEDHLNALSPVKEAVGA